MSLKEKDIKHVAKLSKLEFSDEEIKGFTEKFNDIVDYMDKLNEVDVEGVEPTYHALNLKNVFREDEVKASIDRKEVLEAAPSKAGGCFKVPKVVE
jgi:aspartyl-tRNA(Asn)/glutamyl-tRNA(Gln) amidotransferase subunit C